MRIRGATAAHAQRDEDASVLRQVARRRRRRRKPVPAEQTVEPRVVLQADLQDTAGAGGVAFTVGSDDAITAVADISSKGSLAGVNVWTAQNTFTGLVLFPSVCPQTAVGAVFGDDLVNVTTLTASQSAQDAVFLAYLGANYQPLDSDLTAIAAVATQSFGRALLAASGPAGFAAAADSRAFIDWENGDPVRTVSSTSATDVYSVTLPADTIADGQSVRIVIRGDILQNSGSDQNVVVRVNLGGTNYLNSSASFVNDTDRYGFRLEVEISYASVGAQELELLFKAASASTATVGKGNYSSLSKDGMQWEQAAEDETASMTVAVQMHFVTSTTSSEVVIKNARTEVLAGSP